MQSKEDHAAHASAALKHYLDTFSPEERAEGWRVELRRARETIENALRASDYLQRIQQALELDGGHMLVFRHLVAPPVSQDQFSLMCPKWPKSTEKSGRPVKAELAGQVAKVFSECRDKHLTKWLDEGRTPTRSEFQEVLLSISPLIASQQIATANRNRAALQQEQSVIDLLVAKGWTKLPSRTIDTRAAVPPKHFMHKTRFATRSKVAQEVDIACGLKNTIVLALECKVTNDQTNSVKRINDVLKKARAWREHYGSFVVPAAMLQGVIASKDVDSLIDSEVEVFWSHDLASFEAWIDAQV